MKEDAESTAMGRMEGNTPAEKKEGRKMAGSKEGKVELIHRNYSTHINKAAQSYKRSKNNITQSVHGIEQEH